MHFLIIDHLSNKMLDILQVIKYQVIQWSKKKKKYEEYEKITVKIKDSLKPRIQKTKVKNMS